MGASASQHATSIDFGRRCVACAEARSSPAKQVGRRGEHASVTAAEIAVTLGGPALPDARIRDQEYRA
jgi:hypothetical protein